MRADRSPQTLLRALFLLVTASFLFIKHPRLAELLQAMKFIECGAIRAVMDRSLPLAQARRAHELIEDRAQFGKLVLTP